LKNEYELFDKRPPAGGYLLGVDEVGRGPLAGPVVAACVKIQLEDLETYAFLKELGINDSKKLSSKKRLALIQKLGLELSSLRSGQVSQCKISKNISFEFAITEIQASIIDEVNILNASLLAMKEAMLLCTKGIKNDAWALIDGNRIPKGLPSYMHGQAVVKGDSRSLIIGLASILAKEYRDNLMNQIALEYPSYGLEKHAGYPTAFHLAAIRENGICPIHRKTFKGVREHV
jgi:ribonuclease HII